VDVWVKMKMIRDWRDQHKDHSWAWCREQDEQEEWKEEEMKRVNEWENERMREWENERMKEWKNERNNEWVDMMFWQNVEERLNDE
jgi:hypothetical protein